MTRTKDNPQMKAMVPRIRNKTILYADEAKLAFAY